MVLYGTILYGTILYGTILYGTILYRTVYNRTMTNLQEREVCMGKEDSICFNLKRVNHIVERGIHTSLAAAGFDEVTNMHGWILGFLYNSEAPVYQRDVEMYFSIGRSTVTNILQLMEKKGYLTRTTDENDARLKRLELTELGKKVHLDTIAVIDFAHAAMEDGITDEERRICLAVFKKIRQNVEHITGKEESSRDKNTGCICKRV